MTIEQLFLKCRDDFMLMTKKRLIVPAKVDERTEYLLKFLAHKNGEDHPNYFKNGEYIHGTNIKVVSAIFMENIAEMEFLSLYINLGV